MFFEDFKNIRDYYKQQVREQTQLRDDQEELFKKERMELLQSVKRMNQCHDNLRDEIVFLKNQITQEKYYADYIQSNEQVSLMC